MNRAQIHKLLGGYAAGSLTPEENRALMEAALEDQELFNALAREQSLKELLEDPAARAAALEAVSEPRLAWWRRLGRWGLANAVALSSMAGILLVTGYAAWQIHQNPMQPRVVAYMDGTSITVDGSAEEAAPKLPVRPFTLPKPAAKPLAAVPAPPLVAQQTATPQDLGFKGMAAPQIAVPAAPSFKLDAMEADAAAARRNDLVVRESVIVPTPVTGMLAGQRPAGAPATAPGGVAGRVSDAVAVAKEEKATANDLQTVMVEASAAPLRAERAVNNAKLAASMPEAAGVRIQLQRMRGGRVEDVRMDEAFRAGDVVRLRITAERAGFVAVFEEGGAQALLAETWLRAAGEVATRELTLRAGGVRIAVGFGPRSGLSATAPAATDAGRADKAVRAEAAGAAVYRFSLTVR